MRIKFLGTGVHGDKYDDSQYFRNPHSLLIDGEILVDAPSGIDTVFPEGIEIRHFIASNPTSDDCVGGLEKVKKFFSKDIKFYNSTEQTYGEVFDVGKYQAIMLNTGDKSSFILGDLFYCNADSDSIFSNDEFDSLGQMKISRLIILDSSLIKDREKFIANDGGKIFFTKIGADNKNHIKLREIVRSSGDMFDVPFDGQETVIGVQSELMKHSVYIKVPKNIITGILNNKVSCIVDGKDYATLENKSVYLTDGKLKYGVIRILSIDPMSLGEFKNRFKEHRLSDEYRREKWGAQKLLYRYKIDLLKIYSTPSKLVMDVKDGEIIESLGVSELSEVEELPKYLHKFTDGVVMKDIAVISCSQNRLEVLINSENEDDCFKRLIQNAITENFSSSNKISFRWNGPSDSKDSFVALYDLVLKKKDPRQIKLNNLAFDVSPMDPFIPMKPSRVFYGTNDLLDYLIGG